MRSAYVQDGILDFNIPLDGESGIVTKVIEHDLPTYTGETNIKPDWNGTTLMTANKVMTRNVIIEPIEVQTVSNLSGGNTVYIGGII